MTVTPEKSHWKRRLSWETFLPLLWLAGFVLYPLSPAEAWQVTPAGDVSPALPRARGAPRGPGPPGMTPRGPLKGEGSRQRRPGPEKLPPARGYGTRMLQPRWKGPAGLSRGQEQLRGRNVPAASPGAPGGRRDRVSGGHGFGAEGHGFGAAGPAPPRSRRGRAVPAAGRRGEGRGCQGCPGRPPALTVDVLPVADVLQVAARVLPAELGLGAVGLQPRVGIPAQLGAGGDAAGRGVPHLLCPAPAWPGPAREAARGGRSAGAAGSHGRQRRREGAAAAAGEEAAAAAPCGCSRRRVPPAAHPRGRPRSAARRRGLRQLSRPPPRAGGAGPAGAQPHPPRPAQPPGPLRPHHAAAAPQRQHRRWRQQQPPRAGPRTGSGSGGRCRLPPGGLRERRLGPWVPRPPQERPAHGLDAAPQAGGSGPEGAGAAPLRSSPLLSSPRQAEAAVPARGCSGPRRARDPRAARSQAQARARPRIQQGTATAVPGLCRDRTSSLRTC